MKNINDFLESHRIRPSDADMEELTHVFTEDMNLGLAGTGKGMRMIPTFIEADNDFKKDTPVLAIDAGGTNFRAAIVTITGSGKVKIDEPVNYQMPGLDGEISCSEFFATIADYIRPLADRTGRIGFCFSYPTEILPDRDGILLQFCKEVQAPEVIGKNIGRTLLETLGTPGKPIVLLNDTVATLLAGKSASIGKQYDSFIGYILGTGTNTCYIEKNINILKNKKLDQSGSQIINIESGDFGRPRRSELDILFDKTTTNPDTYKLEKMISGGYLGGLSLFIIKRAADEGFLSDSTKDALQKIDDLSTGEADAFVKGEKSDNNILNKSIKDLKDAEVCSIIINNLIERAGKLAAASMAAVVLKSDKGFSPGQPILITIEGTTFYKLHKLREHFQNYLNNYLSGSRKRYFEFTEVAQSSLIGAALAALIE